MERPLRVLFLASEAEPFIKVGGLGDVAGSLPPVLRSISSPSAAKESDLTQKSPLLVDVRLAIPFHGSIRRTGFEFKQVASLTIPHRDGAIPAEIYQTDLDGLPVYLIAGPPIPGDAPVYTGDNRVDGLKYTFFSLAALQIPGVIGWQPDIIHANDWHTSPAIYALQVNPFIYPVYTKPATLLTVHNLPYLGNDAGEALAKFGLPPAVNSPLPWWAQDMPLPLGLLSADQIVAVSPTYAQEILTPEFSSGLDEFLRSRSNSISGILNGIDHTLWDPLTDLTIATNFTPKNLKKRRQNKTRLQQEFMLEPDPNIPLLAMVTRLDPQKGVDLAIEALRQVSSHSWQVIILGSGTQVLVDAIHQLEAEFPDRVRSANRFDLSLSHRIYAGADLLLIPSRYEPCGLAQMIAMRYGCVPLGRATGGLKDTIHDYSFSENPTGFLFEEASPQALAQTIQRALGVYFHQEQWLVLQKNGMAQDYSWSKSAKAYFSLYKKMVSSDWTMD